MSEQNRLRDKLRYCFKQATMAGQFSEEYCLDRILEVLAAPAPSSSIPARGVINHSDRIKESE
jgi:hypothetical protein